MLISLCLFVFSPDNFRNDFTGTLEVCNNKDVIIEDPTAPQLCCYTTVLNINAGMIVSHVRCERLWKEIILPPVCTVVL